MSPVSLRSKLRRMGVPVPDELNERARIQIRDMRRRMKAARDAKAKAERRAQAEELAATVSLAIEAAMGPSHSQRLRRSLSQAMSRALRKWMRQ